MLEMLVPDEPFPPPPALPPPGDPYRLSRQQVWKRKREKRARYPGYQPGNWIFDFIPLPSLSPEAATPTGSMTAIVRDAKACWSGEVEKGQTKQQFVDWIPTYLTRDRYLRRWQGAGHLEEAAHRIAGMYGVDPIAMRRACK